MSKVGEEIGSHAELRCGSATDHDNVARLEWTRLDDNDTSPLAILTASETLLDVPRQSARWVVKLLNQSSRVKASPLDGSLHISDVVTHDSGQYQCQGYTTSGGVQLAFTHLTNLLVGCK